MVMDSRTDEEPGEQDRDPARQLKALRQTLMGSSEATLVR